MLESATGRPAIADGSLPLSAQTTALAASLLPAGQSYVAQATGAGGRHKAWPLECHVALAKTLLTLGHTPVLILGPDENTDYPRLTSALPGARFPLQEAEARGLACGPELTIALAGHCSAAVAADCGGGHMLAAGGAPMVSLFGPTSPARFAPWASRLAVLRAQQWKSDAMQAIPVQAVLDAVLAMIGPEPSERPASGSY
jgi:ADP-heptose:LPS heptosyltransferase